jgi:hypothetical protein
VAGRVLSEATLQVQGSSLTLGNKQPLPGGITATPDTFKKPRQAHSAVGCALICYCSASSNIAVMYDSGVCCVT